MSGQHWAHAVGYSELLSFQIEDRVLRAPTTRFEPSLSPQSKGLSQTPLHRPGNTEAQSEQALVPETHSQYRMNLYGLWNSHILENVMDAWLRG